MRNQTATWMAAKMLVQKLDMNVTGEQDKIWNMVLEEKEEGILPCFTSIVSQKSRIDMFEQSKT